VRQADVFDRTYRFSSEACIGIEKPLLTSCSSKLLSLVTYNCEFPDSRLATLAETESLYTTEINFRLQKVKQWRILILRSGLAKRYTKHSNYSSARPELRIGDSQLAERRTVRSHDETQQESRLVTVCTFVRQTAESFKNYHPPWLERV
jgi:hypothetical protein